MAGIGGMAGSGRCQDSDAAEDEAAGDGSLQARGGSAGCKDRAEGAPGAVAGGGRVHQNGAGGGGGGMPGTNLGPGEVGARGLQAPGGGGGAPRRAHQQARLPGPGAMHGPPWPARGSGAGLRAPALDGGGPGEGGRGAARGRGTGGREAGTGSGPEGSAERAGSAGRAGVADGLRAGARGGIGDGVFRAAARRGRGCPEEGGGNAPRRCTSLQRASGGARPQLRYQKRGPGQSHHLHRGCGGPRHLRDAHAAVRRIPRAARAAERETVCLHAACQAPGLVLRAFQHHHARAAEASARGLLGISVRPLPCTA
mmetsp:Transcript_68808/g.190495  ORF Transcript_68808/g.190495 Transcript_68808/m.190495 type:complete len:312 (+) Transcript_68808:288-1223(+)